MVREFGRKGITVNTVMAAWCGNFFLIQAGQAFLPVKKQSRSDKECLTYSSL